METEKRRKVASDFESGKREGEKTPVPVRIQPKWLDVSWES